MVAMPSRGVAWGDMAWRKRTPVRNSKREGRTMEDGLEKRWDLRMRGIQRHTDGSAKHAGDGPPMGGVELT